MRILPTMLRKNNNFTQFIRKNTPNLKPQRENQHQYTGVASTDLAYASMFDNEIAKDLKLMGLI